MMMSSDFVSQIIETIVQKGGKGEEKEAEILRLLCVSGSEKIFKEENVEKTIILHYAIASFVSTKILERLIEMGAEVNATTPSEETPLHLAARQGDIDVVRFLVAAGANISIVAKRNYTPLVIACQYGRLEVVKFLVDGCSADVNEKNGSRTPLMAAIAVTNASPEVVDFLLSRGANPIEADENGFTSIHEAVSYGHDCLFFRQDFLHFVDEDAEMWTLGGNSSFTLLMLAVGGSIEITKYLISKGVDVNAVGGADGKETPLLIASRSTTLECGRLEVIKILLQAGADPNATNSKGENALHILCFCYQGENEIEALCKAGANANACDSKGTTPLHIAAKYGRYKSVKALLQFGGASVNVFENDRSSPLHQAVLFRSFRNEAFETIKALIEEGDCTLETINALRSDGKTVHYLSKKWYPKIVNLLESHGATTAAVVDNDGEEANQDVDEDSDNDVDDGEWQGLYD